MLMLINVKRYEKTPGLLTFLLSLSHISNWFLEEHLV